MFTLRSLVKNANNFPELHAIITGLEPIDSVQECASHTWLVAIKIREKRVKQNTVHCEWYTFLCSSHSSTSTIVISTRSVVNFTWCFIWLTHNRLSHTLNLCIDGFQKSLALGKPMSLSLNPSQSLTIRLHMHVLLPCLLYMYAYNFTWWVVFHAI